MLYPLVVLAAGTAVVDGWVYPGWHDRVHLGMGPLPIPNMIPYPSPKAPTGAGPHLKYRITQIDREDVV